MNQQCKVCGEPAAGFHFGAFTCEGCKSFFGRSYNNLGSISECKNNGECVINKKNRTSCKACRLRKCLLVGMSKSGSRYGRRSNWFKIHCLLQEQQQQQQQQQHHQQPPQHHLHHQMRQKSPPLSILGHHHHHMDPRLHHQLAAAMSQQQQHRTKEDLLLLGLDEYKGATSPSVSSPESHNSDSSVEVSDQRLSSLYHRGKCESPAGAKDLFVPLPFLAPGVFPHAFLPAPFLFPAAHGHHLYPPKSAGVEPSSKRFVLDAILKSQMPAAEDEDDDGGRSSSAASSPLLAAAPQEQENPMDLSMKGCRLSPGAARASDEDSASDRDDSDHGEDADARALSPPPLPEHRATPMDLTTRA